MKALRMFAVLITLLWALPAFAVVNPYEKMDMKRMLKAAEDGDATALTILGILYDLGSEINDIPKDKTKAKQLIQKAADQGYAEAQTWMGDAEEDHTKKMQWYLKAANQNHPYAQYRMGVIYYFGQGVQINHYWAASWWQKAAEQGNTWGQYNLGLMYYDGEGVIRDRLRGCGLIRVAAEKGYIKAIEAYNNICAN